MYLRNQALQLTNRYFHHFLIFFSFSIHFARYSLREKVIFIIFIEVLSFYVDLAALQTDLQPFLLSVIMIIIITQITQIAVRRAAIHTIIEKILMMIRMVLVERPIIHHAIQSVSKPDCFICGANTSSKEYLCPSHRHLAPPFWKEFSPSRLIDLV